MKNYVSKWLTQRITAIILIPLTFWFVFQCMSFSEMNYSQIVFFFNSSLNSSLFLVMMVSMLLHSKIGCETILEDYVKSYKIKKISKLLIKTVSYFSIIIVIISIVILMDII